MVSLSVIGSPDSPQKRCLHQGTWANLLHLVWGLAEYHFQKLSPNDAPTSMFWSGSFNLTHHLNHVSQG